MRISYEYFFAICDYSATVYDSNLSFSVAQILNFIATACAQIACMKIVVTKWAIKYDTAINSTRFMFSICRLFRIMYTARPNFALNSPWSLIHLVFNR